MSRSWILAPKLLANEENPLFRNKKHQKLLQKFDIGNVCDKFTVTMLKTLLSNALRS